MTENRKIQLMDHLKPSIGDEILPATIERDLYAAHDMVRLEKQMALLAGIWVAMQPALARQSPEVVPFFNVITFELEQLAAVVFDRALEVSGVDLRGSSDFRN